MLRFIESNIMHLKLKLGKDIWSFTPSDDGLYPVMPLASYGELKSSRDQNKALYYALDKEYQIWLGLRKTKEIILEHFNQGLAMDVLYNYNVLAWIKVAELIPADIYSKIRKYQ